MPLLRFDLIEGRSEAELTALLDTTHEVVLAAFGVPARDRYQIVHEHKPSRMIVQDTGLDIARTDKVVMLQITTRPRKTAEKQAFYKLLCETLEAKCGISPSDVVVSLVENTDEDWSFGLGRAQFLTGEL
jgi:phenylpyruvate tautomerase PptA (4-oxalocrotonate tautomerase family)